MSTSDFYDSKLYINRELSLLQFNYRVLEQAKDPSLPLLERLRYLFICSSNLDEFFEVRVAGLKEKILIGSQKSGPDGLSPTDALQAISETTHELVAQQYKTLNEELIPALAKEKIHFIPPEKWSKEISGWIKKYFRNEALPVISPIGLDMAHPFPRLVNKSLNFLVSLEGKDAFGRDSGLAIVHAPSSLPRVIKLPEKLSKNSESFIFLSSIINAHAQDLFPGMTVTGCYQFRLTRNSDLSLDDEVEDLVLALKTELLSRRYRTAVRLEIDSNCPSDITEFLLRKYNLTVADLYHCEGPVNLTRYTAVLDLVDRPDLRYEPFTPALSKALHKKQDVFYAIRQEDILLHHPFESFSPVVAFIHQATEDPDVLAIKQTLYRTNVESLMVKALIHAAIAGKEVTAVIELRARFDEASNIQLANKLQEAGALVVYGIVGFKTHAKMTLVVRREGNKLQRYAHLGTGNYHANTALQYTDIGLLTYDQDITHDVQKVFQQLTGMGKSMQLKKLLYSPFTIFKSLINLIENEITLVNNGKQGHIIIKTNGLTDEKLIGALYRASQAGVKVDLIVRGICCIRPGLPGISDNIKVRSVVDRFLEHSRIFYFKNDGKEKIYCSSADWMERNLYYRVELCFPILDKLLVKRIKQEGLLSYLADNQSSWQLNADGSYKRIHSGSQPAKRAQRLLLEKFGTLS